MKIGNVLLSLLLILSLLNFSPHTVGAEESEEKQEIENELIDESIEFLEEDEADEESPDDLTEELVEDVVEEIEGDSSEKEVEDSESTTESEEESIEKDIAIERETVSVQSSSVSKSSPVILKNGVRHADVKTLKANLKKLGFTVPGNGTTLFGNDTEKKVKEFQTYYRLTSDGVAGPATLSKIQDILSSPLQNGKRHQDTVKLKKDLDKLGFTIPGTGTTLYGKETEKKVKEFQKKNGLVVNGIGDFITLEKIAAEIKAQNTAPLLKNGVRHADVKTLKANLKKLGFTVPGNGTTLFGNDTEKKVKEFQTYYRLTSDGVAGPATLSKIQDILSSPLQNGKRHQDTIKLKKDLDKLGFTVPGTGTTLYGKETEKKVREFQKKNGLVVNGIGDFITLEKIAAEIKAQNTAPLLKNGVRHADVKTLKVNLKKLGFTVPGNGTTLFGNDTEKKVKEFQAHYGLISDGIAGSATLAKIDNILKSPFQLGKRHQETVNLKKYLGVLNLVVPGNGTTLYGRETEKKVKEFQRANNLPVSGIADEVTFALVKGQAQDKDKIEYTKYNVTFKQALDKQMSQLQQTDKYRNQKAYVSGAYVNFIGLISADKSNLRSDPSTKNTPTYRGINKGTKVAIVKEVKGENFRGSNVWYEIIHNDKNVYAHSSILNPSNSLAQTTDKLNVRAATNTNSHIYGVLAKGAEITILSKGSTWHEISYSTWRNPTRADVEQYLNPNNNDKYQHLVLSASVQVSASELNKVLDGKGVLQDLGQAFINAGNTHSVNELYLISHALLETGHGTSKLATGIEVGLNSNKNPVLVTSSNRGSLTSIKTTYNMFGIGASDADPNRLGAIRAYKEGWFTPEAAIIGGAKIIGERYIHNTYRQNTLYKMRWNPENPGYPQYATDIAWAVKQVTQIKNMYNLLDNPLLYFDIPQYK